MTIDGHVLLAMLALGSGSPAGQAAPCDAFVQVLEPIPHVSLTLAGGPIESLWFGEPAADCQVSFETTDSVLAGADAPDLEAEPGTRLYDDGWRAIPDIIADGAGTGVYGIARGPVRCVISWAQPSFIDDDGTFVQSDTLDIIIQCRAAGRA